MRQVPELLSPAGSLEAARAAIANGANAVYCGVERFNARDEGAQLTLDELGQTCALAHRHGARIYLTLNTLIKPGELADALGLLGNAIDRGVDAAIVQDIGLVRLIQRVYPAFEIHGSTQLTVHDAHGARLLHSLGVRRVVMARENTLEDLRAIRTAVPELELEAFVHGALCISYSGQCFMSGLISERSANRGSCAQSCRKDYVLRDSATDEELDRGYLISAKDLAAYDSLPDLAEVGVKCLKIEGRKKKAEYVAIVTKSYRNFLDEVAKGTASPPRPEQITPLVQIYSRGFTSGMMKGRAGRSYVTRDQPDNRGHELGVVVANKGGEIIVEVTAPIHVGDGLGFEPPGATAAGAIGFSVQRVRTLASRAGVTRQAIASKRNVLHGWRVVRSSQLDLLNRARASYESLGAKTRADTIPLSVRVSGASGAPLKASFAADGVEIIVESRAVLARAHLRALDDERLRENLGRLGGTVFALQSLDTSGLASGLFLPVSELNHIRQEAIAGLQTRRERAEQARRDARSRAIQEAVAALPARGETAPEQFGLVAEVHRIDDARRAASAGATEIVFDPFLRHPVPPVARIRSLADELNSSGISLRLRTPTIIRPEDYRAVEKWLATELPLLSGHVGLACQLASAGRDVVLDYAANCFNQHTAAEFFARGVRAVTSSVELSEAELREMVAPWNGRGFHVVVYGRPEGMTIEHCVLSAAFDREPATCRDLCVSKHPGVSLTDAAGYTFPVATDSDCRNRLLHSRPIEASEFLPKIWKAGIRSYRLIFNVPDEPVAELVGAYRSAIESLSRGDRSALTVPRALVGSRFTRGHFARPV
jgi:U32 family peptidase